LLRMSPRHLWLLADLAEAFYRSDLKHANASATKNIGKPVVDLTGDDREGA